MATTQQTQDYSRLAMTTALKAAQCATHCIENSENAQTIKLCLDTAHLAEAAGMLTARGSDYARRLAQIVHDVATKCAESCGRGDHQIMQDCAASCRELAESAEGLAMEQGANR